jgi:hypothetical protein
VSLRGSDRWTGGADGPVKNDTFRTLATDTQFKGKVKEDMLIRLLEAFVWKNQGMSAVGAGLERRRECVCLGGARADVGRGANDRVYSSADEAGSERDGLPFTYVQG